MSAYVPPALRNKPTTSNEETSKERRPDEGYSIREICHQFDYEEKPGTLNGVQDIRFILLFRDQHPSWPPKIFCKSNLQILPVMPEKSDEATPTTKPVAAQASNAIDERTQTSKLIPVFTQDPANQKSRPYCKSEIFVLHGMFTISNIRYLEPNTEELVQMLELKFPPGQKRLAQGWKDSLGTRWAVIELHQESSTSNPMIPLKQIQKKSVNQLLEEMRLSEAQRERAREWAKICKAHGDDANQRKAPEKAIPVDEEWDWQMVNDYAPR